MFRRAAFIFFILFEAFFLNVAVPGHERGRITVPGYQRAAAAAMSCCAAEHRGDHAPPTPADRAHCAMCFFAAGLCLPPAPIFAPTPWGRASTAPMPQIHRAGFVPPPLPYHGRAPPAAGRSLIA